MSCKNPSICSKKEFNYLRIKKAPDQEIKPFLDELERWQGVKRRVGEINFKRAREAEQLFTKEYWPILSARKFDKTKAVSIQKEIFEKAVVNRQTAAKISFWVSRSNSIKFREVKKFADELSSIALSQMPEKPQKGDHIIYVAWALNLYQTKKYSEALQYMDKALAFNLTKQELLKYRPLRRVLARKAK